MKVLSMYYSLSGETEKVVDAFTKGLSKSLTSSASSNKAVRVDTLRLQTNPAFCFPWKSLWSFFDIMAECVVYPSISHRWKDHGDSYHIESPTTTVLQKTNDNKQNEDNDDEEEYDVIIIGWQTWFLSPCLPIQLALSNDEYQRLLFGKKKKAKQIVLIGTHRNMWHKASRTLQRQINSIAGGNNNNAAITGHVNFVQQNHFIQSIYHTLNWQLKGNQFKGKATLQETVEDQAFDYGQEFATNNLLSQQQEMFYGGSSHQYSVELVEQFWFPFKHLFANIMGLFPPTSIPRRAITVVYVPLLLVTILGGGVPVIFIGSLIESSIKSLGSLVWPNNNKNSSPTKKFA